MNPSSLLHVSTDLLRDHLEHGMPAGPMGAASDRRWALGVCALLAALAGAIVLVLLA